MRIQLTLADVAFAVLLWGLLILRFGYTYGTGDHAEILPYVLFLKHPELYAHDLFIQGLHASQPNERTVMATILSPMADHMYGMIFALHFANTVLLLLALVRLAHRLIGHRYMAWLAVCCSVLILNNRALGDVDLYTPSVQVGDIGCMIIAWALNLFLDRRYMWTAVVMSLATLVHVLEGFDAMAVLCLIMLWQYVADRSVTVRELISYYAIYLLIAGPFLVLIFIAKTGGSADISTEEVFDIMFAFRHPHHFIFSTFPLLHKLLFLIYVTAGLVYYSSKSKKVFRFIIIGTAILAVYIVAVDVFHVVFIANFQWYKVTQWIKFFGVVAAVGLAVSAVKGRITERHKWVNRTVAGAAVMVTIYMLVLYGSGALVYGYRAGTKEEIGLCRKLKDICPMDAVFIQPFEMTGVKFHAQRASYVDFKAIPKNQKDLKRWYARVQEVYGLDYHLDKTGFGMQEKADAYMDKLSEAQLAQLKAEGVTHMICHTAGYQRMLKLILSEQGYWVYEL